MTTILLNKNKKETHIIPCYIKLFLNLINSLLTIRRRCMSSSSFLVSTYQSTTLVIPTLLISGINNSHNKKFILLHIYEN